MGVRIRVKVRMPSSMDVATTCSASSASIIGSEVTRIRSSGNWNDAAKSSGGTW